MNTNTFLLQFLASTLAVSSLSAVTSATEESPPVVECGLPFDVWEATADPVPEGIAYEYVTDAEGNFLLVEPSAPLDTGFLPDENHTGDNIPPATAYEYIIDENGNYILIDDQGRPVPIDEEMTYIPSIGDMIYPENPEYPDNQEHFPTAYDDMAMEIQPAIGGDLLSDAFDPDGEPMPEGAFASPMTPEPEPETTNWFVTLFQKFLSLFSK